MADKPERIKLITPPFRGSYVNLVKARSMKNEDGTDGEAKFGMVIVLEKELKSTRIFIKKLEAAIQQASAAKHGQARDKKKLKHYPIVDGDTTDNDSFQDCWIIRASSKFKPHCISKSGEDLITEEDLYSGAWYRANISPWGWANVKGGKGVSIGLDSVMKVKDDTRFGGGSDAKDDFKDHISEDEDEEEDDRFT